VSLKNQEKGAQSSEDDQPDAQMYRNNSQVFLDPEYPNRLPPPTVCSQGKACR
jgi:hypothetical protein